MMSSLLFSPFSIGRVELPNRIVIPPMCQYSALNGVVQDWHLMHYGMLSLSGAGLLIVEATAVAPEGRISAADLGLWDAETEAGLNRLVTAIRRYSDMPLAVQLAHAGRKASVGMPWQKHGQIAPSQPGGWQTVAPSAIPFSDKDNLPTALDSAGIRQVIAAFADAAERAERAGFNGVELHVAHGYLLHEFLSPLSNQRTDAYGGSLGNRMRLVLEVFQAVRQRVSAQTFVSVRISATDWVAGGWSLEDAVVLSHELEALGCDAIHVSSGGLHPQQQIRVFPGYQVPHARKIKENTAMPVIAVGLITQPEQAESIVGQQQADLVALGRQMLCDMHWPWRAALALGAKVQAPPQYWLSRPEGQADFFIRDVQAGR